jgi:peptide/nickel transport system ATP-binding protein
VKDLHVEGLTVRYHDFVAVDDISFDVAEASVLGLAGESGSGKSTVARAIAGLVRSRGIVQVGGRDVRRNRGRRLVQLVFQDPMSSLDPRFTIRESLLEALPEARLSRAKRLERVDELLTIVALDPAVALSRPRTLSGGQRQRVAIARALAAEPEVLIADEVTASLDVSVQAIVLNLLKRIQADFGLTMLFITHNLAVVRYMCNDLAILNQGKIVEYGPVGRVIEQPADPYTAALVGAVLRPGVRPGATGGGAAPGRAPSPGAGATAEPGARAVTAGSPLSAPGASQLGSAGTRGTRLHERGADGDVQR